MQSLRAVTKNRTTIMIAHRLSTVQDADGACRPESARRALCGWLSSVVLLPPLRRRIVAEIVVLHEGEVVERGSHTQLLQREGRYAAMWHRQHQAY